MIKKGNTVISNATGMKYYVTNVYKTAGGEWVDLLSDKGASFPMSMPAVMMNYTVESKGVMPIAGKTYQTKGPLYAIKRQYKVIAVFPEDDMVRYQDVLYGHIDATSVALFNQWFEPCLPSGITKVEHVHEMKEYVGFTEAYRYCIHCSYKET